MEKVPVCSVRRMRTPVTFLLLISVRSEKRVQRSDLPLEESGVC